MYTIRTGTVFAALLALSIPAAMEAQGPPRGADRGSDREERARDRSARDGDIWDIIRGRGDDRRDRDARRDDRDRRDDRNPRRANARGGGPPFCQNGQGHPVFGRQWCRDKGFGIGDNRRATTVEDIIFGTPRRERDRLDRRDLSDVLGDIVLGRIEQRGSRLGMSAPLSGEWFATGRDGRTLRVLSGGVPIAELVDLDDDGVVDVFRLRRVPGR